MLNIAFQLTEANGQFTANTVDILHESELSQHDVKCGRGSGSNEYCGNKNFLELVANRRDEYLSTKSRIVKARIAREVVENVKSLDPPGRFLERARRKTKNGECLWMVVNDEKKCTEKVKQACRETWHRKGTVAYSKKIGITRNPSQLATGAKRKDNTFEILYPRKKMKTSFTNNFSHIHKMSIESLHTVNSIPVILS
jgi:hypothetical protein